MASQSPYLNLSDLTGGINDADSPFSIEPNQVTEAKNLDFRAGRIGTKRGGMEAVPLTNAVFASSRPRLATTDKNAVAAGTLINYALSPYANTTDATGNTYHHIVVFIITNPAQALLGNLTVAGTPLNVVATIANGAAGQIQICTGQSPPLAGGTINGTVAGATAISVIAQRWTEAITGFSVVTATGNSATPLVTSALFTEGQVFSGALAVPVGPTVSVPLRVVASDSQGSGAAQAYTQAQVGQRPTAALSWLLSAPALWAAAGVQVTGRDDATGFGAGGWLGVTNTIKALVRHTPTNDPTQDELWAFDSWGRIDRYVNGVWQGGVPVVNNNILLSTTGDYHTNGVSLHGKLFLALLGNYFYDRLVVWDGTVLRWAGLTGPTTVPTGANTGAGTFATTRYYRVRWTEQSAGATLRRSEPSPVMPFTPSGAGTGVIVTRPVLGTFGTITGAPDGSGSFEGQTHWELEASTDNVLFYVIGTAAVATTTITDSAPFVAGGGTYTAFLLSENIGEYVVPTAPRHVAVDQDRLMLGGSPFSQVNDSRVSWTPVRADTGAGNDERIPITARFFQDLDGLSGGCLNHLIPGMMGGMYAFKLQRIYKLVRTGSATRAYDVQFESASRGSFMRAGRLSSGINGAPVIYFVDPNVGLCAFSDQGVEDLMQTRRTLAARINKLPTVLNAKMVVFSKHWIVWVWVSLDGATVPNYGLAYNIRTRGWTDITGGFANVVAAVPCFTTLGEVPYVAVSAPRTSYICEADTTVTDDGLPFRAWITSKPMQLGQLYRKFGIQAAVLHAKAAVSTVGLALIRNLGLERKDVTTSIAATAAETYVVRPMDNAVMSECQFVQFELGDPVTYAGAQLNQTWTLDELAAKLRSEEESTS